MGTIETATFLARPYLENIRLFSMFSGNSNLNSEEVDFILNNRSSIFDKELNRHIANYSSLSETRQAILIAICLRFGIEPVLNLSRVVSTTLEGNMESFSNELILSLGSSVEKLAYAYEVDRI